MTLSDLRKITIRKRLRIRFRLSNGLECLINERGMAQVPDLHSIPDFNLEQELAQANEFLLEAVQPDRGRVQTVNREQLDALAAAPGAGERAPEDHQ